MWLWCGYISLAINFVVLTDVKQKTLLFRRKATLMKLFRRLQSNAVRKMPPEVFLAYTEASKSGRWYVATVQMKTASVP